MASTVYVGLALTSHDTAQRATATFTNVTARTPTTGTNQPPTVSITSPAAGATFAAPAAITVTAAASDTDGAITKVDFYRGTQLIGSDTTNSYSASLTGVAAGTYQLTAVATDSDGVTSTSSPVSVTVSGATNQPPTVSLTSPAPSSTFTAPASITLAATASDADGIVSRVDFYRGSTKIGVGYEQPIQLYLDERRRGLVSADGSRAGRRWGDGNVGCRQYHGLDDAEPAADGVDHESNCRAVVYRAGVADDHGRSERQRRHDCQSRFLRGSQLIASDTSSPYQAAWSNVAAGNYSLTAVARDNLGGTRTSSAVAVTITAVAPTPTRLVFTASADHATNVTSYTVAIYRDADVITTASPVATRDIGKPTPVGRRHHGRHLDARQSAAGRNIQGRRARDGSRRHDRQRAVADVHEVVPGSGLTAQGSGEICESIFSRVFLEPEPLSPEPFPRLYCWPCVAVDRFFSSCACSRFASCTHREPERQPRSPRRRSPHRRSSRCRRRSRPTSRAPNSWAPA